MCAGRFRLQSQQCLHNVWRSRALKRLLASEAPSEAGQGGDQIAARGGILATADGEDEEEAAKMTVIPTESLLLTRFASERSGTRTRSRPPIPSRGAAHRS